MSYFSPTRNNPRGEEHPRAKLTAQSVRHIRADRRSSTAMASLYGVSPTTIRSIRIRRTWKHVP